MTLTYFMTMYGTYSMSFEGKTYMKWPYRQKIKNKKKEKRKKKTVGPQAGVCMHTLVYMTI